VGASDDALGERWAGRGDHWRGGRNDHEWDGGQGSRDHGTLLGLNIFQKASRNSCLALL